MIQYKIIKYAPGFLRWYRTKFLLDLRHIKSYLPGEGKLLDVGCGVGLLDYEIARHNPRLNVLGIDIAQQSIELAQAYHTLPNVEFSLQKLESVEGQFDCILFVDVFHHVPPQEYGNLLQTCKRLLAPGGYVLIKDVERRGGQVSLWLDRYISGCKEVYLHNCEELVAIVSRHLKAVSSEVKFRFPFPNYYIKATRPPR
jgi:2-polyprenyl-3-methyl-5-hydroxy-6-metoxy-1,4-benzoquinol methylase